MILNIGLIWKNSKGEQRLWYPEEVRYALVSMGLELQHFEYHARDGEEPFVVVRVKHISGRQVGQLCNTLKQDCVALVNDLGEGMLAGPRASEWGEFDYDQFTLPGGQRGRSQVLSRILNGIVH